MVDKKQTVLVVDDEVMNVMILSRRLKKEGFVVEEASDGQVAIDMVSAAADIPDIVLMDLMMPNLDGWEATKKLKEKFPHIKVIAVSAKVDEEMRSAQNGFDDFCPKPVNFKLLISKIEQVLQAEEGAA